MVILLLSTVSFCHGKACAVSCRTCVHSLLFIPFQFLVWLHLLFVWKPIWSLHIFTNIYLIFKCLENFIYINIYFFIYAVVICVYLVTVYNVNIYLSVQYSFCTEYFFYFVIQFCWTLKSFDRSYFIYNSHLIRDNICTYFGWFFEVTKASSLKYTCSKQHQPAILFIGEEIVCHPILHFE